jgi:hypothetical protein
MKTSSETAFRFAVFTARHYEQHMAVKQVLTKARSGAASPSGGVITN